MPRMSGSHGHRARACLAYTGPLRTSCSQSAAARWRRTRTVHNSSSDVHTQPSPAATTQPPERSAPTCHDGSRDDSRAHGLSSLRSSRAARLLHGGPWPPTWPVACQKACYAVVNEMLWLDTLVAAGIHCAAPASSGVTELHYLRAAKTGSTSTVTLLGSARSSRQPGSRKDGNWSIVLHLGHRTTRASLPAHAHTLTTLRDPCERFESGFHWARPRRSVRELIADDPLLWPGMTPLRWAAQLVRNTSYARFWLAGRAGGACHQANGSGSGCFAVPQHRYVSNTTRIACLPSLGSDLRRIVGLVGCESACLGTHELRPETPWRAHRPPVPDHLGDAPLAHTCDTS